MKNCFRPHQGIILFNSNDKAIESLHKFIDCFRPHQGIILFNLKMNITQSVTEN